MTIAEFRTLLEQHPQQRLRFVLPDGEEISPHFHLTEAGYVQKSFVDCAGRTRTVSACVLQAWIARRDEKHVLMAHKVVQILDLAQTVLPGPDLPMEIEYDAPYLSQFPIQWAKRVDGAIIFHLAAKHAACLALESCGPECATSFCCIPDHDTGRPREEGA